MKLLVNLFYILISIFITGIVLCIFVDKNSVFSRVAVGLVTGSFVAGVNALTSYLYQRKRFFRGLVSSMKEVGEALYDDFEKAFIHADYILTKPNEELRKSIPEYMEAREKESSRKDHHYKQLYRCFDYQEFTPMIKTSFYYNLEGWYEDFKNMFLSNYMSISHDYQRCYDKHSLISWEGSYLGTIIQDSFIDHCREQGLTFKGRMAYDIILFKNACTSLSELIKGELPSHDYEELKEYCESMWNVVKNERFVDRCLNVVDSKGNVIDEPTE